MARERRETLISTSSFFQLEKQIFLNTRKRKILQSCLHALKVLFWKIFKAFALFSMGFYRSLGTLFLGGACRFQPSCSEYAAHAFNQHHPWCASKLVFKRVLSCRPGGNFGFDPVPKHLCGDHK